MKRIKFYKMHGTGNDFICIDNKSGNLKLTPKEIIFLCHRHFGIGADGVILMEKREAGTDIFMNYWNADGTQAEMCGNGVRCTAHFARDIWNIKKENIKVLTRDGIKEVKNKNDNMFTVNMGTVSKKSNDFPNKNIQLEDLNWSFVSVGNPHAVSISNNLTNKEILNIGRKIENNLDIFPNKINVNFIKEKDNNTFFVSTWERGAGKTLSCGTGATASFSVILEKNPELLNQEVQLNVPGGTLFFKKNIDTGDIFMTGPSKFVFKGSIEI